MAITPVLKSKEFANIALDIYNNLNTVYAKGGFGQLIDSYTYTDLRQQYPWNADHFDQSYMGKYAVDCICWIKGELWGWRYNQQPKYGSNGVPDMTDQEFGDSLTDLVPASQAKEGYGLWKKGHCGMCVGNGMAIDADYSTLAGKVVVNGMKLRKLSEVKWTKCGKFPYIDYTDQYDVRVGDIIPMKVIKIDGNMAYGEAEITPAPEPTPVPPTPAKIVVGSKVTINPGAKNGGTASNRGVYIDEKYANGKFVDTVTAIETHYGVEEALLKQLWSWIATSSLTLVQ